MKKPKLQLQGQRFGKLLVVEQAPTVKGATMWRCVCDCGGERVCIGHRLTIGFITSCGCMKAENRSRSHQKHGLSKHRLFTVWWNMMCRCYEPKNNRYYRYGARGIAVCPRWHDVRNFISDMQGTWFEGGELDRKDNDGDYEPDNCRWVTALEQARNRSNTYITESMKSLAVELYRTGEYSQVAVGLIVGNIPREAIKHVLRGLKP